jgi:hypothetical protein
MSASEKEKLEDAIEILVRIGSKFYSGVLKPYPEESPQPQPQQTATTKAHYELPPIPEGDERYKPIGWVKGKLTGEQEDGHLRWQMTQDSKKIAFDVEIFDQEHREKVEKWFGWASKAIEGKKPVPLARG